MNKTTEVLERLRMKAEYRRDREWRGYAMAGDGGWLREAEVQVECYEEFMRWIDLELENAKKSGSGT